MGIAAQIQEFGTGSPEPMQTTVGKGWKLGVNANELFGMRIGKRLKQDGIDHRENSSGGSDPEHQTEHCRRRKAWVLAHHTECKLKILPQRVHRQPSHDKGTLESFWMFPAT